MKLRAGWTSSTSWMLAHVVLPLSSPLIIMVQPTHDRTSDHFACCILRRRNQSELLRDLLPNALMGSCLVEVAHIRIEHALELPLMQDQQVVQAFLSDAPQIAFADGIGSWCMIGGFEQLDATGPRYPLETRSKLAVVIPNEILGYLPKWGGFP